MKFFNSSAFAWLLLIVFAVLAFIYIARKGKDEISKAASAVATAVDPTSPGNIVYSTVDKIVDRVDDGEDNESFSLGAKIYDWMHPDEDLGIGVTK